MRVVSVDPCRRVECGTRVRSLCSRTGYTVLVLVRYEFVLVPWVRL